MDETHEHEPSPEDRPPPASSAPSAAVSEGTEKPTLACWVARALLNMRSDALVLADREGHVLFVNQAAARHLGKPAPELLSASVWHLWPEPQRLHMKLIFDKAARTGTEVSFVERTGDSWSEFHFYPLRSAAGQVEVVAVQSRDVSRRIAAEEKLKRVVLQLVSVQEDERRRIAQDLHDDIGQRMAALLLSLKATEQAIATGRQGVEADLRRCVRDAEALARQMRKVLYDLRPPALRTTPLRESLEALCSSFAQDTGLHVDLSCQEALPLIAEAQAVAIYRLVQEALHNALKHARATRLWVSLDFAEGEVAVSVEDDGQGFEREHAWDGMGLQGIRDRFLLLGGTFDVETAPGEGTRLFGSLPVAPPATEVSA